MPTRPSVRFCLNGFFILRQPFDILRLYFAVALHAFHPTKTNNLNKVDHAAYHTVQFCSCAYLETGHIHSHQLSN